MPESSSDKETPKLKEQYVPLEQRASQHVKPGDFVKDMATILGIAAVGAIVGRLVGKWAEPRKISLGAYGKWMNGSGLLDANMGAWLGGKIGGIYGIYHHWRKSEAKQMGVANISGDLKTAIDDQQLKKDTYKETELLSDIQKLQERMAQPKSHIETVAAQREAAPQEAGRV